MFKHYKDISDVVSLLVYCPSEKSYLLTKEANGEFWIPSSKVERSSWKMTAHKINFEIFGLDAGSQYIPLRVHKIWMPSHQNCCVYHAVYKVAVKTDVKKRTKMKANIRNRLQWFSSVELERQRAHSSLRSPEVAVFAQMAVGDHMTEASEMEIGTLIEICEDSIILGPADVAGGAVAVASPNYQLVQAAGYTKDDQYRLYREFLVMVFPALYMSPHVFTQFMLDLGWQRAQCSNLFRAADITCRGGLSFLELMLWTAALEPATQHSGLPAEIRCRYIFRYFDGNRDLKLEYVEFKELIAAARAARQLPIDALSVARDADLCLRQLGMQPNCQLPLAEFLRGVSELHIRGTSSLLRAPRSIIAYLVDLQERDRELIQLGDQVPSTSLSPAKVDKLEIAKPGDLGATSATRRAALPTSDFSVATHTVKLNRLSPELLELSTFDEDAVSPSAARLVSGAAAVMSVDVLGPGSAPAEALAAVHYFAAAIERSSGRSSMTAGGGKPAWTWAHPSEQAALGALLLRLAAPAAALCAVEPRLLRICSPVYAIGSPILNSLNNGENLKKWPIDKMPITQDEKIVLHSVCQDCLLHSPIYLGDLHGNLPALLSMEAALWPTGVALSPARLLFLGDYVDRGALGAELMAYLLAAKLQRPNAVLLLRGNHETRDVQKMFTFYNECISKYGEVEGVKIWNAINDVFDALPLAAVVDDKVFCCHGGIPPPWVCPLISAIDKAPVPLPRPAEQSTIAWELLWNDPVKANKLTATLSLELSANEGFAMNARRGTGHVFDQRALDRFLLANRLSHVVRAHEAHHYGFRCQLRGRLVSVFSSSHYCGGTNDSGVALIDGGKLRLIRINVD